MVRLSKGTVFSRAARAKGTNSIAGARLQSKGEKTPPTGEVDVKNTGRMGKTVKLYRTASGRLITGAEREAAAAARIAADQRRGRETPPHILEMVTRP